MSLISNGFYSHVPNVGVPVHLVMENTLISKRAKIREGPEFLQRLVLIRSHGLNAGSANRSTTKDCRYK